ncbi:MAG: thiamine-phosphate kinase [Pyrodictiaceae archaeon]
MCLKGCWVTSLGESLASAGETKVVERILKLISRSWKCNSLEPGDDAVCVDTEHPDLLVKIDGYSVSSSLLPWMSLYDLGWKSITAATSDLVAKGGKPLVYLISIGLSPNRSIREVEELVEGAADAALAYGGWLGGGDTNGAAEGHEWIDVASVARAKRVIGRNCGREFIVYVTKGRIGLTGVALKALETGEQTLLEECYPRVIAETKRPYARIAFANLVEKLEGCITCSSDVSDGLAYTLYQLSLYSRSSITIEQLPIEEEAIDYAKSKGLDPVDLALYGGEEYEIVFGVKPECEEKLLDVANHVELEIARVGKGVGGEPRIVFRGRVIAPYRWDQFRKALSY